MAKAKPMLQLVRQLNKTKSEQQTDVEIRIDTIIKGIKNAPKPTYTQSDVINYLDNSKSSMKDLMNKIFEGFQRIAITLMRGGNIEDILDDDLTFTDEKVIENLRSENSKLKKELASFKTGTTSISTSGLDKEEFMELQTELNNKEIQLQKKDFEIQKMTNELQNSQETIQNYQYKIAQNEVKLNEYSNRITTLETDLGSITRQNNLIQNQFNSSTQEISLYRKQLDDLQISNNRKDREIKEIKAQFEDVKDLEEENERLRQAVVEAADRIKKSASDIKDVQDQAKSEISRKEEEIRTINNQLLKLQEDKELLLIDSQEVSKGVNYYRTEFEKVQQELQSKQTEMDAMEVQLNMFMTDAVSTSTQSTPTADPLSMLDSISKMDAQDEQFEEIQKQLTFVTEERNKGLEEIKRYTAELGNLTSEITDLNRVVKRLEADKAGLIRDLDTLKQELDLELEQRKKLQEASNKYRLGKSEAEQKFQDLSVEYESLKASIEGIKRDYERKLKSTDDLDNRIKDLREEREKLESSVEELNKQLKKSQKDNREINTRINDLELEIFEKGSQISQLKKEIQLETKEKDNFKQQLDVANKELDGTKFKLDKLQQTSTAVEAERNNLLETMSDYRLRETDLKQKISTLETKLRENQVEVDNYKQELGLKEKQIEVHLARQKELNESINKLRFELEDIVKYRDDAESIVSAKNAELESLQRQVEKLGKDLANLEKTLKSTKDKLDEISEEKIKLTNEVEEKERRLSSELDALRNSTSKEIESLQKKFSREKELSEFYKRSLEDDPKYMILLILNEVRKATTKELERTTRRPNAIVKRIVKSLEGEGYLKVSADEETVEMVKNFPPI